MPRRSDKKQASVSDMVRSLDQQGVAGKRPRVSDGVQPSPPQGQGREDVHALRTMFREEVESLRRQSEESISSLRDMLEEKLNELFSLIDSKWQRCEERLSELEKHAENKDVENDSLHATVKEQDLQIHALNAKLDDLEARSRRNTLVFSGSAIPRRPALRPRPSTARPDIQQGGVGRLPAGGGPTEQGQDDASQTQHDVSPAGGDVTPGGCRTGQAGPAAPVRVTAASPPGAESGARRWEDAAALRAPEPDVRPAPEDGPEDVEALLIDVIRDSLGITVRREDIDHAHRMSAGGSKIVCRFTKSGPSSIRQQIYDSRIPRKGERPRLSLYVNESLSQNRQQTYLKILELKRSGRVHTVFTRAGGIFFKERKFGVNYKANSLAELEKRLTLLDRSKSE